MIIRNKHPQSFAFLSFFILVLHTYNQLFSSFFALTNHPAKDIAKLRNRLQSLNKMADMAGSRREKAKLELQIDDINEELQDLLRAAERRNQCATVRVEGFHFPLVSMVEIERLEEAVRKDFGVRDQYVRYLSLKKPPSMDVTNFFSYLFTDDALMGYNYSGTNNIGEQKLPMRNYEIFIDCMIEAWADHGLTHKALEEKIKVTVKKLTARRRMQKFRRRKAMQF